MAKVEVISTPRIAEFFSSLQDGVRPWHLAAMALLDLVGTSDAARIWLHTPNPDLEGHAPLTLMEAGEAEVVAALLRDALVGQQS